MAEIHDLNDHQARVCEQPDCGSTKFNLLRSGKIECALCGDVDDEHFWLGTRQDNPKIAQVIVGIMALTKDNFKTVVETLIGVGADTCEKQGLDYKFGLIEMTDHKGHPDGDTP